MQNDPKIKRNKHVALCVLNDVQTNNNKNPTKESGSEAGLRNRVEGKQPELKNSSQVNWPTHPGSEIPPPYIGNQSKTSNVQS